VANQVDVQKKLDEIAAVVGGARSMPMSASCVVNRAELLALLDEVREALPGSLARAQEVLGDHAQVVARAHQEAQAIIQGAHAERGTLISDTQVARQSRDEAERILDDARREAEEIRAEADDYVDSKLANFEVVLTKTIGSVDRGREKLLGRGPGLDEQGFPDQDAPEHSSDPRTLVARADEYVDAKLGAFEAVLSKTLEAVGRGRGKLQGRTEKDALGEHMAAADAAGGVRGPASDADYLAGLAEPSLAAPDPHRQSPQTAQPLHHPAPADDPYAPAAAADAYGYGQTGGYAQDPYAAAGAPSYPGQQPYAAAPDPYAYGAPDPHAAPAQTPSAALDETSFFDTSMIDMEQFRRYEQGR
jgi:cell division septum initiation protein DivIVA